MRVQFFMMGASIFPEAMHVPFLKIFNYFSIITLALLTTKGSLSFVFIPYWKPNVLKLNNHWFIFFFLKISRENCNFRSEFEIIVIYLISHQFSSVPHLCPIVCDPMNRSMPGIPVHHQLLEFTQTHVHRVGDAIQPSHHLSSPSPPAPNPSQHQGLSQWVNSSHELAKVLESQLQHQSFQWAPRIYLLQDGLVGSPCSPRDAQESSPTPQFKSINSLALSFLHSPNLASIHDHWKTIALITWTFFGKVISLLFNMLPRLVITFLPRNKNILISWLWSPSAVILEPPKIKSDSVSTVSPFISH